MILAKVVGTVVATEKEASMNGLKLMLVQPIGLDGSAGSGFTVAVDAVGCGVGEIVLYASGSSARQTEATNNRPCDAVIMAIVDNWEVDGTIKYKKGSSDQ